jgi:glycerophosphoryl diester phosphodiesterase
MRELLIISLFALLFQGCKKTYTVTQPDTSTWQQFTDPATRPLNNVTRNAMDAVYGTTIGADFFGDQVAIKWSYSILNNDTSFHVSGFFGKDIAYFVCEGKQLNGSILLNGYWRKMVSTETGIIRLTINPADGGQILLSSNPVISPGTVTIKGVFGNEQEEPHNTIEFKNTRKLNSSPSPFRILAHRSGGRTSDLLPVSENSVEMILMTPQFGSTGIEIDVRLTKDSVPILYHDQTLNLRQIQKSGLIGPIENYTYEQLTTFVKLIRGEKIPTLRDALNAVVYQTPLTFVWLDMKYIGSMAPVQALQKEFLQKAAANGRSLEIVIGLPTEDQLNSFLELPDHLNTPVLCELSLEDVKRTNAKYWAPRFTQGTQNEEVDKVHADGRMAFVWTLDVPEFINTFVNDGHFDGILSNYPSCVAYNYYVHQ